MSYKSSLAVSALVVICACSQKAPESTFDRVGVLPFDNLSTSPELEWIGVFAPLAITTETMGAERMLAIPATGAFDLARVRATRALRGYYQVEGSRLHVHATLTDVRTAKTLRTFHHSGALSEGPLPVMDALSRDLAGRARPYPSSNRTAVADLGNALLVSDPATRAQMLEAAWRKDSSLSDAALEAAQARLASGDSASAVKLLQAVAAGADSPQATQARILLARDSASLQSALEQAVRYSPRNADFLSQLGQIATRNRDYAAAETWFRKALAVEPDFAGLWNMLSYAQAYAGRTQEALISVERLRAAAPQDPNSYDSGGEINWMAGHFDQAYKRFLDAQQKEPLFQGGLEFAKAAFSRLMAGDIAGADQLFDKYLESRRAAADPIVDLRHAHWMYLTNRKQQAFEEAAKIQAAGGELASRAASFQAIWMLQEKRKPEAQAMAAAARALARSPGSAGMATIAGLLASPSAPPAQWQARARALFPPNTPPNISQAALAYALFLDGHYQPAATLLEGVVKASSPSVVDEPQALLAGAALQSGDAARAAQSLVRWPLPPIPGESVFASMWFPGVIEWRAKVIEQTKGPAAAVPFFSIYNAIVGR